MASTLLFEEKLRHGHDIMVSWRVRVVVVTLC